MCGARAMSGRRAAAREQHEGFMQLREGRAGAALLRRCCAVVAVCKAKWGEGCGMGRRDSAQRHADGVRAA